VGFENLREAMALITHRSTPHRVSVSVAPTIAERWLAPRLSEFLIDHPEIDLRIDSTHHLLYETDGEFDFAIRYAPPSSAGHEEIELFGEYLIPVCTPDVAASVQAQVGADALIKAPLLHVDRETSDPDWVGWEEWGANFGFAIPRPSQGLRFTRTTLALRSVFDGHGLLLSQLSITLPDIASGRLVAPFGPSKAIRTGYPYRLVLMGRGRPTSLQHEFKKWVCSEADKARGEMEAYLAG
jgi:LysR family glycine cleavage system transcriptional activator